MRLLTLLLIALFTFPALAQTDFEKALMKQQLKKFKRDKKKKPDKVAPTPTIKDDVTSLLKLAEKELES